MTNDQEAKSLTDEQLLAVVDAATPGEWRLTRTRRFLTVGFGGAPHISEVDCTNKRWEANATFQSTFDPPQVRALILRAQAAEARVEALLADHARLVGECSSRIGGSGHSGEQPVINHGATAALAKDQCHVTVGAVIAAGIVMQAHGEDTIAGEILQAVGVESEAKARLVGVDDYDIQILAPVFADFASRRKQK